MKNFKGNKLKLSLFSMIVTSLLITGPAFAENINESSLSNQENNLENVVSTSWQISQKQNTEIQENKLAQNNDIPAVDIKKEEKKDGIVPVFELKGGVKETETKEESALRAWIRGNYATGNWHGLRTKMEEHGITLTPVYYSDTFSQLHGGSSNKFHTNYIGLLNTKVSFDTEKMGLWRGGTAVFSYNTLHGESLTSNHVKDYQLYDNLQAPQDSYINEYWYQQSLLSNVFKIKMGKQDANCDFSMLESGFNFINTSFSLVPTIPIPVYPYTAAGISASIDPVKWFSFKTGFFDGASKTGVSGITTAFDGKDGWVSITEVTAKPVIKGHAGKYIVGMTYDNGNVPEIAQSSSRVFSSKTTFYTGFEQMIYKEKPDDTQGLTILSQYGWAPSDRTELARYYSVGAQYKGLIPKRNNDIIGIGSAMAKFSKRTRDINNWVNETALEIFYKIQLTPWLAIQPDLQHIYNPGGNRRDSTVLGIRSIITF